MEFKSKASVMDLVITVFTDVFFLIAVVLGVTRQVDVLAISILLAVCGAGCTWYVLRQPTYVFGPEELAVKEAFPLKDSHIPYGYIVDFRPVGRMRKMSNRVDVIYKVAGKDRCRSLVCTPADTQGFLNELKKHARVLVSGH